MEGEELTFKWGGGNWTCPEKEKEKIVSKDGFLHMREARENCLVGGGGEVILKRRKLGPFGRDGEM